MKIVQLTRENERMFLETIPRDVLKYNDLFLGAIDEDTDTACGVLAALIDEEASLVITYIYVAEGYRMKGAGSELIKALKEYAAAGQAEMISCVHAREPLGDGVYELLDSCGFVTFEEATTKVYSISLSDIDIPQKEAVSDIVPLKDISHTQWNLYEKKMKELDADDEEGYYLPLAPRDYDMGKVKGALLADTDKNGINLDHLRVFGEEAYPVMLDLIITAAEAVREKIFEDVQILFSPLSDEHKKLMDERTGDRANIHSEAVVQFFMP